MTQDVSKYTYAAYAETNMFIDNKNSLLSYANLVIMDDRYNTSNNSRRQIIELVRSILPKMEFILIYVYSTRDQAIIKGEIGVIHLHRNNISALDELLPNDKDGHYIIQTRTEEQAILLKMMFDL